MEGMNEKPWHGLGAEIDPDLSPHEMLVKAKLDYKRPYKSPANHETFRFFKSFAEAGEAHIQTVGQLDGGRIIWALAGLNVKFTVNGGDPVEGCLLFASRDEKRDSVHMLVTAVREVCGNTFQVASEGRSLFKNTFRRVFIPTPPFLSPAATHLDDKMIQKAKENIGLAREAIAAFASDAERLADRTVDEVTAHRYMVEVFQSEQLAEKKTRMAIEAMTQAPGQNLEVASMTAWDLLNAVAYTVDHQLSKNQDSRLRLAWFGSHADIKKRAFDQALKLL
jgi:phage/plasmid-like protein (TIGR03299 family)